MKLVHRCAIAQHVDMHGVLPEHTNITVNLHLPLMSCVDEDTISDDATTNHAHVPLLYHLIRGCKILMWGHNTAQPLALVDSKIAISMNVLVTSWVHMLTTKVLASGVNGMQSSIGQQSCLLTDEWLRGHELTEGLNFFVCKVSKSPARHMLVLLLHNEYQA